MKKNTDDEINEKSLVCHEKIDDFKENILNKKLFKKIRKIKRNQRCFMHEIERISINNDTKMFSNQNQILNLQILVNEDIKINKLFMESIFEELNRLNQKIDEYKNNSSNKSITFFSSQSYDSFND